MNVLDPTKAGIKTHIAPRSNRENPQTPTSCIMVQSPDCALVACACPVLG